MQKKKDNLVTTMEIIHYTDRELRHMLLWALGKCKPEETLRDSLHLLWELITKKATDANVGDEREIETVDQSGKFRWPKESRLVLELDESEREELNHYEQFVLGRIEHLFAMTEIAGTEDQEPEEMMTIGRFVRHVENTSL